MSSTNNKKSSRENENKKQSVSEENEASRKARNEDRRIAYRSRVSEEIKVSDLFTILTLFENYHK